MIEDGVDLNWVASLMAGVLGHEPDINHELRRISSPVEGPVAAALAEVVTSLAVARIGVADLGLRRPTLDDVFLHLTGHKAEASDSPETLCADSDPAAPPPGASKEVMAR